MWSLVDNQVLNHPRHQGDDGLFRQMICKWNTTGNNVNLTKSNPRNHMLPSSTETRGVMNLVGVIYKNLLIFSPYYTLYQKVIKVALCEMGCVTSQE